MGFADERSWLARHRPPYALLQVEEPGTLRDVEGGGGITMGLLPPLSPTRDSPSLLMIDHYPLSMTALRRPDDYSTW